MQIGVVIVVGGVIGDVILIVPVRGSASVGVCQGVASACGGDSALQSSGLGFLLSCGGAREGGIACSLAIGCAQTRGGIRIGSSFGSGSSRGLGIGVQVGNHGDDSLGGGGGCRFGRGGRSPRHRSTTGEADADGWEERSRGGRRARAAEVESG